MNYRYILTIHAENDEQVLSLEAPTLELLEEKLRLLDDDSKALKQEIQDIRENKLIRFLKFLKLLP